MKNYFRETHIFLKYSLQDLLLYNWFSLIIYFGGRMILIGQNLIEPISLDNLVHLKDHK